MNFFIYLKLIRWKNLLLITYTYYLIIFHLFPHYNIKPLLTNFQLFTLYISVISITAAGYIINDIFDVESDRVNKPNNLIITKYFSEEKAILLYRFTNAFGIFSGIALSLKIEKPPLSFVFIGTALLLYYYSKSYKKKPLIGNLLVSFLIALSIFIILIFSFNYPLETNSQKAVFNIIIALSVFAFLTNLTREILKDIEDVDGDYKLNMRTLPILIGRSRSKQIASYICLISVFIIFYFIYFYSDNFKYSALFLAIFSLLPLLFSYGKMRVAKTKKQFHNIGNFLKIIMFLGITSILIFTQFD